MSAETAAAENNIYLMFPLSATTGEAATAGWLPMFVQVSSGALKSKCTLCVAGGRGLKWSAVFEDMVRHAII